MVFAWSVLRKTVSSARHECLLRHPIHAPACAPACADRFPNSCHRGAEIATKSVPTMRANNIKQHVSSARRKSPSPPDTRASMRGPLPQFVSPRRRNCDQIGSHYARQQFQATCCERAGFAIRIGNLRFGCFWVALKSQFMLRPNRLPLCASTISNNMLRARWMCHPHW